MPVTWQFSSVRGSVPPSYFLSPTSIYQREYILNFFNQEFWSIRLSPNKMFCSQYSQKIFNSHFMRYMRNTLFPTTGAHKRSLILAHMRSFLIWRKRLVLRRTSWVKEVSGLALPFFVIITTRRCSSPTIKFFPKLPQSRKP